MDGLTCEYIMGFYEEPCDTILEVQNPPPGTTIGTVCPRSCSVCDGPVEDYKTTATTTTPPHMGSTTAFPIVTHAAKKLQTVLDTDIKAMCRAKLSLFNGVNLKPDKTGKSKFALKELTKANRCVE